MPFPLVSKHIDGLNAGLAALGMDCQALRESVDSLRAQLDEAWKLLALKEHEVSSLSSSLLRYQQFQDQVPR